MFYAFDAAYTKSFCSRQSRIYYWFGSLFQVLAGGSCASVCGQSKGIFATCAHLNLANASGYCANPTPEASPERRAAPGKLPACLSRRWCGVCARVCPGVPCPNALVRGTPSPAAFAAGPRPGSGTSCFRRCQSRRGRGSWATRPPSRPRRPPRAKKKYGSGRGPGPPPGWVLDQSPRRA